MNAPFRPGLVVASQEARRAHRSLIACSAHAEGDGYEIDADVIEVVGELISELDDLVEGRRVPRAELHDMLERAAIAWRAERDRRRP